MGEYFHLFEHIQVIIIIIIVDLNNKNALKRE